MKKWDCLTTQEIRIGDYSITAVQPCHINLIRIWRNAQKGILRQTEDISPEQQERYYSLRVWPEMSKTMPANIIMSYFFGAEFIGYGGLVHIAWKHLRAEVSFLVAPERVKDLAVYMRDQMNFLSLMKMLAFDHLGFYRIFTETYDIRPQHISNIENSKFIREGVMRSHVRIDGRPVDSLIHGCLNTDER